MTDAPLDDRQASQESLPETLPASTQEQAQPVGIVAEHAAQQAEAVAQAAQPETPQAAPPAMVPTTGNRPVATPATNGGLGVESMSWDELKHSSSLQQYCTRCQQQVCPSSATVIRKKRHSSMQCQQCHNTLTLMYKRWDMSKLNFREMADEEQVDFFRKAKELTAGGKRLEFGKVKALLMRKMIEVERNTTETAVKGKFLPLSVWEKKGFDVGAIQQKAEQQKSDLFGVVYRVPILEINYGHIEESVRESILQAERRVKPSKRILVGVTFFFLFFSSAIFLNLINFPQHIILGQRG